MAIHFTKRLAPVAFGLAILLPVTAIAEPSSRQKPDGVQMTADFLIARPLGLAYLGIGTGVFVATLPFSLIGGNVGDASKQLVIDPAMEVFARCLGCEGGRKERVRE